MRAALHDIFIKAGKLRESYNRTVGLVARVEKELPKSTMLDQAAILSKVQRFTEQFGEHLDPWAQSFLLSPKPADMRRQFDDTTTLESATTFVRKCEPLSQQLEGLAAQVTDHIRVGGPVVKKMVGNRRRRRKWRRRRSQC